MPTAAGSAAGGGSAGSGWLAAGIGFAISIVLFSIGAIPDNFIETIGCVLMIASTVWIAAAAGRRSAPDRVATTGDAVPAGSHPQARQDGPARVR